LKRGPIGCPETSVRHYQYTVRTVPEERKSHSKPIIILLIASVTPKNVKFYILYNQSST